MNDFLGMAIGVEIEPIVKLVCQKKKCRFNIDLACNLKRIVLDSDGCCKEYEPAIRAVNLSK